MRILLALVLLFPLLMPCAGCGGGGEGEDFVDTSDPDMIEQPTKPKPGAKP